MKIKKSELKTCKVAYLYQDGHMVLIHEKRDRDAGRVEYATIYEDIGIKCAFEGRLIIDNGALPFILEAANIQVLPSSIDQGSQLTKDKNIRVETIILKSKYTNNDWIINSFPDFIASDIKYQGDVSEKFADIETNCIWGMATVKKIYRVQS